MVEVDSDSSSQGFEFVDATQFSNADMDIYMFDDDVNKQQNMQILKESWQNMVNKEDGDQRLLEVIYKNQDPSGFKMVPSYRTSKMRIRVHEAQSHARGMD